MEGQGFHGYRKLPTASSTSEIMNQGSNSNNSNSEENECTVREQDRFMPIANVIRIMRKILPPHAKISDDAKETIQECVSEYISFITGEANERCQREQRKTITAEDVLYAMSKLGFDDYIEPLTLYLHRYREVEGDRGIRAATGVGVGVGDQLVKRSSSSFDYVSFPPTFHVHGHAHHHSAPAGFFGGYMMDASNSGAGLASLPNGNDPHSQAHYKK